MRREKLIQARKSKDLTQTELALEIGFSYEAVSKWERGRATPHLDNANQVAAYFGVSKEDLDLDPEKPIQHERHEQPVQEDSVAISTSNRTIKVVSRLDIFMNTRRDALHQLVNGASTLLLFPYAHLPEDDQKQLTLAQIHPSYLDERALANLSATTVMYWGFMNNSPLDTLLDVASHHFETVLCFLKDSHSVHIYNGLCVLAIETAQLLGSIFHRINEDDLAYDYYTFALKVALDVGHTDLWASGVGRLALLQLYWKDPRDGLPLLQAAQHAKVQDPRLRAWLPAIEAEIYAEMDNMNACQRLLEQSKGVQLSATLENDIYWTSFDPSLRHGYEGACYVRLHKPDLAIDPLQQSLKLMSPTLLSDQNARKIDIGSVHAQLGDPKRACELLSQSLRGIIQRKSVVGLQRVYKARAELQPWGNSAEVRELDDKLDDTVKAIKKRTADS